jgi:hypothetical protein
MGHLACTGEIRDAYKNLEGKPEERRPLERRMLRWEDNTKMYVKRNRFGEGGLDSSGSGKGPVDGSCEQGNEPSGSIKCGEFLD